MALTKRRDNFFDTEEGVAFVEALRNIQLDTAYNTEPSYSANVTDYPENLIPFVDKHKNYLAAHPSVDSRLYLANLRLMTRRR